MNKTYNKEFALMAEYKKCECFGCKDFKSDGTCSNGDCEVGGSFIEERCPECPQGETCDVSLHPELYSNE